VDPKELKELRKYANAVAESFGAAADIERLDLTAADIPGGVRLRVSIVLRTPRGMLTDIQEFWVPLRMVKETVEGKVRAAAAQLAGR
jgi:hypothetical protein